MDDREYFDQLYQLWSNTTYATDDSVWLVQEDEGFPNLRFLKAAKQGSVKPVADFLDENDAQFITTMHGVLPELVRRLNDALDEADRLDVEKDELHGRIMELEQETEALEIKAAEAYEIGHGKGYNEGYEEGQVRAW